MKIVIYIIDRNLQKIGIYADHAIGTHGKCKNKFFSRDKNDIFWRELFNYIVKNYTPVCTVSRSERYEIEI